MSTAADITRQKDIFLAALRITDDDERERFLAQSCKGDETLLSRLRDMLEQPPEAIADDPQSAAPGDKVGYFGDYVLLDEIARGAMGVVFRARQMSLDRVVALKMLRDTPMMAGEEGMQRLRAEATAAASLDHPNILPIYEVGVHEGQWYYSMKLVKGGTLQFRIAEFQNDARKAVALMIKVARAIHHAHASGILHRDLKPANVLIDAAGEPQITDFGLARKMGVESGLTMTGQVMGTPHYMSPEQARGGNRELTPATDIYSLGAMLYELLAGRRAYATEDLIELLKQVTEAPVPALPDKVPAPLAAIVMKSMAKEASARHATAGDFADDLEGWLRGEPPHLSEAQNKKASRSLLSIPRRSIVAAIATSATIALAFGAVMLWKHQGGIVRVTTLMDELDPAGTTGSGVSLREALRDAPENGRIRFSQAGKIVLSDALGAIKIDRSVIIEGAETEIHTGPGIDRAFFIASKARLSLENVTLSGEAENARHRGSVGAIDNGGTLEAIGCRFLNNGGGGNGGAIASQGDLTLKRCVFQDNLTNMLGGAIHIDGAKARVDIEDCSFAGNRAAGNGGSAINVSLQASGARVRLARCTLAGNIWQPEAKRQRRADAPADKSGGALHILAGSVSLERCVIAGNLGPDTSTQDVLGSFEQSGPNFIGGDPKDAPAELGACVK